MQVRLWHRYIQITNATEMLLTILKLSRSVYLIVSWENIYILYYNAIQVTLYVTEADIQIDKSIYIMVWHELQILEFPQFSSILSVVKWLFEIDISKRNIRKKWSLKWKKERTLINNNHVYKKFKSSKDAKEHTAAMLNLSMMHM